MYGVHFVSSVVYVSVVDTDFTVYENEGALHLCLQVNHTVRTRAVVEITTSEGSATGMKYINTTVYYVYVQQKLRMYEACPPDDFLPLSINSPV